MIINLNNKDYDFENDVLYIYTNEGKYGESVDLDDVILDIGEDGNIIGIEILDASKIFKVDKYDLLKNLIKFEAVIKITKDVIKLNMKLEVLKRNKEIVRESTIKGLNYNGLNEGEMEIAC
jgi:uncharacterized protein YuzE